MNDTRRPDRTNGDQRGSVQRRRRGLHGGQEWRGNEIVMGSINESSGKIVRGREYRRSKLDRELKGWVMKGGRLDEWLESKCERVCWAFVPHNWSRIKLYLSSTDHSRTLRSLLDWKCIKMQYFLVTYKIIRALLKFKHWLFNYRVQRSPRRLFSLQTLTFWQNRFFEGQ